MAITYYPDFSFFEDRNKQAVNQHRQVWKNLADIKKNAEFCREGADAEKAWLADKDNLPIWAGGKHSVN
jgi:hypothetical protein